MNITPNEICALLGEKDIIIFQLQKKVNELMAEITALKELKVSE